MQMTRESDYAIRCVYYLCARQDRVTMVGEIAREMCVPRTFLAKIVQKLARAKIIKSHRGVRGGFRLARRPRDISLLDVMEAVEGPVAMNVCALDRALCGLGPDCPLQPTWVEVRKKVEGILRKKNFARILPPQDKT
jgi:Rrf2 family protein